jgi:hypothetical protein
VALDEPQTAGIAEILKLFSGRRRHRRTPCDLPLEVRGRAGRYSAHLINISPRGALVGFDAGTFLPSHCAGSLLEIASLLRSRFPHGMTIRVLSAHVRVDATVVRVARDSKEPQVVVGCLFRHSLSHRQCRALGIVEGEPDDGPPLAP